MSTRVSVFQKKLIHEMMVSRRYNPQPDSNGFRSWRINSILSRCWRRVAKVREPFSTDAAQNLRSPDGKSSTNCAATFPFLWKTTVFRAGMFSAWADWQPTDSARALFRGKTKLINKPTTRGKFDES